MGFLRQIQEFLRDKTRDRLCVYLHRIGVDAKIAERNRREENIIAVDAYSKSLGILEISEGYIRWINIIKRTQQGHTNYYLELFLIL